MGTRKLDSLYAAILGSFRVFVESSKLFSLDIIWHCEGRGSEEETPEGRPHEQGKHKLSQERVWIRDIKLQW